MRFAKTKSALFGGVFILLGLGLGCLFATPVKAELQAGRDAKGTLWLSDQGLPTGVRLLPSTNSDVMTLAPPAVTSAAMGAITPMTTDPQPNRTKTKDKPTCRGIEQRYEDARAALERTEREKASGKLLIPDSGLITMRQNLASLERLQALCQ